MTTPTTRLGLLKPTTSDDFSTAEIAGVYDEIDKYPGDFICTSSTRPTWGANQANQHIFESDTVLRWKWTGSAWARASGRGRIAQVQIPGDTTNTTGIFTTVHSASYAMFPGVWPHFHAVTWYDIEDDPCEIMLTVGTDEVCKVKASAGSGGTMTATETFAFSGSQTIKIEIRTLGTTSTIKGPINLSVFEV